MIPSRGLPPVRRVQLASRSAIRQFSSVPRGPLGVRSARPSWQSNPRALNALNAQTVRNASWYAPWTWGGSSTPAATPPPAPAAPVQETQAVQEHAVASTAQDAAISADPAPAAAESAAPAVADATTGSNPGIDAILEKALAEATTAIPNAPDAGAAAITHYGALKEMGLDFGWGSTAFFEWLIEHMYLDTGLGWGASILLSTLLIRVGIFGLQWRASDNMARIAAVNPLVGPINEKMRAALQSGDASTNRVLRNEQKRIYDMVGASPFKTMPPMIIQGVLGFGAFRCLRNMSNLPVPEMSQGGFLWFMDLTAGDPYFVLPLLSGAIFYLSVKKGGESGAADTTMAPGLKKVMLIGLPAMMTAISMAQPASLQLYLVGTAITSAITSTTLRDKRFREWSGLAPLPTPEAQAMWTKVAKGEIPLDRVVHPDGTPKSFTIADLEPKPLYQAPKGAAGTRQVRGLNVRSDSAVPAHLASAEEKEGKAGVGYDRDHDYDNPPTGYMDRVDWLGRNYSPTFVWRRMKGFMVKSTGAKSQLEAHQSKHKAKMEKRKQEEYERRRRERFAQK